MECNVDSFNYQRYIIIRFFVMSANTFITVHVTRHDISKKHVVLRSFDNFRF